MQGRELDALSQHGTLPSIQEVFQAPSVRLPVQRRDDQVGKVSPDCFTGCPSECVLRRSVPPGDGAADVHGDDGVERRIQDQLRALLTVPQSFLGSQPFQLGASARREDRHQVASTLLPILAQTFEFEVFKEEPIPMDDPPF